jgi:phosphatidylglycerophosphate synthase
MTQQLPKWVYIFSLFALFLYQTMDAIDGKHARNTSKQSPLGELFDHGLDCFSYCFTIILACQGLKAGASFVSLDFEIFTYVI